jgi:hypothetical protein
MDTSSVTATGSHKLLRTVITTIQTHKFAYPTFSGLAGDNMVNLVSAVTLFERSDAAAAAAIICLAHVAATACNCTLTLGQQQ